MLKLCLYFSDLRREFDFIDLRDEHPDDPIPTSVMFVPPPTVSPSEKRELRARFAAQKLMSEGEETPQVAANAPVERVTHLLSHESPAVFVEMESGKLEVLTKFDLMDTIAGLVGKKH